MTAPARPGAAHLRQAVAGLGRRSPRPPLDVRPTSPFEVAVAEHLRAIDAELDQLRSRLNWLLTVIVGAAITNIVIALVR